MLYPAELRALNSGTGYWVLGTGHNKHIQFPEPGNKFLLFGRGREIRTPDILLPKQARYQTALYPVLFITGIQILSVPIKSSYPSLSRANASHWQGREITPGFLPSALRAALRAFKIAPGNFVELPTSCSQSRRATRLRYTPNLMRKRKRRDDTRCTSSGQDLAAKRRLINRIITIILWQ
jgi:hypothetical protein